MFTDPATARATAGSGGLDLSARMRPELLGDVQALPLADGSVDAALTNAAEDKTEIRDRRVDHVYVVDDRLEWRAGHSKQSSATPSGDPSGSPARGRWPR